MPKEGSATEPLITWNFITLTSPQNSLTLEGIYYKLRQAYNKVGPMKNPGISVIVSGSLYSGLDKDHGDYLYPFAGHRVLHLSTMLASFILRTFLVSYSGVLENPGKAFKLTYAKPLRCIAWPAKGYYSAPKPEEGAASNKRQSTDRTQILRQSLYTQKSVRVVRGASKPNKYAPPVGLRYDGLYTVAEEVGKTINGVALARFKLTGIDAPLYAVAEFAFSDIFRPCTGEIFESINHCKRRFQGYVPPPTSSPARSESSVDMRPY